MCSPGRCDPLDKHKTSALRQFSTHVCPQVKIPVSGGFFFWHQHPTICLLVPLKILFDLVMQCNVRLVSSQAGTGPSPITLLSLSQSPHKQVIWKFPQPHQTIFKTQPQKGLKPSTLQTGFKLISGVINDRQRCLWKWVRLICSNFDE